METGELNSIPLTHAVSMHTDDQCRCKHSVESYAGKYLKQLINLNLRDAKSEVSEQNIPAVFDFEKYGSLEGYNEYLSSVQKGNWRRQINRAAREGYYCAFFDRSSRVPDIHLVNTSTAVRAQGEMSSHYFKSIEELGGYPTARFDFKAPKCNRHWDIWLGVFQPSEGYRQGDVVVGSRLFAYAHLRRLGDLFIYALFLGHYDYLKDGVMQLLHSYVVESIYKKSFPFLGGDNSPLLVYGGYKHGGIGRETWKRRAGFEPATVLASE
ncbi:putative uncharacterized protein (plasmid) [Caballeronia insecticola]|uniref:Uncharacterized protein n=2 Tax=Caballeronia insecticola TaxID=758793 RepID=A0A060PRI3_9BURK|nr:putative uncharacterized protein [Caballeronia insecticola]